MPPDATTTAGSPTIIVVDDDPVVCQVIRGICESVSYRSRCYGSATEFFAQPPVHERGCIVLDVRLPGMSGLDLQDELRSRGNEMPVIFISGYGDIPMAVRAMKGGAMDFLVKPFRHQEILDAIAKGLRKYDAERAYILRRTDAKRQLELLTTREREVLREIVSGRQHKQIADGLKITQTTVKLHRSNLMKKLDARSVADLVRFYDYMAADDKTS